MHTVTTEKFDGPLNILLDLIESEKLDICQISLSKITDSYLARIETLKVSSEDLADFLVIATKLLYLKSKELLPQIASEEEDEEIAELERNLLEYQRYKNAAEDLGQILAKNQRSFVRNVKFESGPLFSPPSNLTGTDLFQIFQEALSKASVDKEEVIPQVKITVEDKKEHLKKQLKKGRLSFRELFKSASSRVEIIITFLAVLEMVRQKEIGAEQKGNFGELMLYRLK